MSEPTAPAPPMTARLAWALYADALDLVVRATLGAGVAAVVVALAMFAATEDDGFSVVVGTGGGAVTFLAMLALRSHQITKALMGGTMPRHYVTDRP